MITFTDKKKWLKGLGEIVAFSPKTGNIVGYSNKIQTGNVQTSVTMGEIRAGIGNAVAAILPSDASLTVDLTSADFNLDMKAAQMGATVTQGAPVLVCEEVTATGAALAIAKTSGTPVRGYGMSKIYCYVQEVGAPSPVAIGGIAYEIDPDSGAISGFTATSGVTYKVWYHANKASAKGAVITTAMDPAIVNAVITFPVFENGAAENNSTRTGTLYITVPYLKLGANGGVNGDQSNNDTTSYGGQAIAYDSEVVESGCSDCRGMGLPLAYYVYVPCDETGIFAALGTVGSVNVKTSETVSPTWYLFTEEGSFARADPQFLSGYTSGTTSIATVNANTGAVTGVAAGTANLTASYNDGVNELTGYSTVVVTAG